MDSIAIIMPCLSIHRIGKVCELVSLDLKGSNKMRQPREVFSLVTEICDFVQLFLPFRFCKAKHLIYLKATK